MKRLFSRRQPPSRRGSTLVEVLVAMAILSIMVAGILQLFSLALLASAGAAARTDLLFKCQQVVENVRFCYGLTRRNAPLVPLPMPAGTGLPNPLVATPTTYLPYNSGDSYWAYWGPNGANIMEEENGPYKISYTIERSSVSAQALWVITVTAIPTDDSSPGVRRFFGVGLKSFKRVDYVAAF